MLAATALLVPGIAVVAPAVFASSVTSAQFTGGAGTTVVGGVLYAKRGAALTLTVNTTSDTECVKVSGTGGDLGTQTSDTPQSTWTFARTAGPGNGTLSFTVVASNGYTSTGTTLACSGASTSTQVSYVEDNSGPTIRAVLSPPANAAGWNNTDVTVSWTAVDPLSGPAGPQPFQTNTITTEGLTPVTTPGQVDRLGNLGSGGLAFVLLDKTPPTITATQTQHPDGTTTISFTCTDPGAHGRPGVRHHDLLGERVRERLRHRRAVGHGDRDGRRRRGQHHRDHVQVAGHDAADAVRRADHAAERERVVRRRRQDPLDRR